MKKTISVSLNGTVFNIEEDGYERLEKYLAAIRDYFESPEEEEEIIADIESNIAEKFSERLGSRRKVVSLDDIEEVIKVMGTVEEIGENEERKTAPETAPVAGARKLYRDPDNAIIAGVCSGIAAYFGIDPVFIRLIFVLLFFVKGTGALAYLILWIIMPKAETNAQKLEMRGKAVSLSKLRDQIKKKSAMIAEESRGALNRNRGWFHKIISLPVTIIGQIVLFLKRIGKKIFPAAGMVFGLLLAVGMAASILGVSVGFGVLLFNADSSYVISDLPLSELADSASYGSGVIAAYLATVLPLLFFFFLGVSLARRKNTFRLAPGVLLIAVWMFSVAALAVCAVDLAPKVKAEIDRVNGETRTENYDIKDFDRIRVGGNGKAIVNRGQVFDFKVTAGDETLKNFKYEIKDGELTIEGEKRKDGICFFCFARPRTIEITMPELKSFIAYGSISADSDRTSESTPARRRK